MPALQAHLAPQPFHLRHSLALQALGKFDPTASLTDAHFHKSFATPTGTCTVTIATDPAGIHLSAEGPEAESTLTQLTAAFEATAIDGGFTPTDPLFAKLHREHPGLRLLRVPWLFDVACGTVLQQRVRFTDACSDWRHLTERFGTRTPAGTAVFPTPAALAAIPTFQLQALGIDAQRSRALTALARELRMNPLRPEMTFAQLRARLTRIPGIGPWTVETILGFGAGDPDALPTGDLYLPHLVAFALTGQPTSTDEHMLQLLEPLRPHRFRVVRLLYLSGLEPPRTYQPRPSARSPA